MKSLPGAARDHAFRPALAACTAALAALPEPACIMIEATIALGDKARVCTVAKLMRKTTPDDGAKTAAIITWFADPGRWRACRIICRG
jgi:hypothetical protein